MNGIRKYALLMALVCLVLGCCTACGSGVDAPAASPTPAPVENIDYAAAIQLNMASDTIKQEVTVKAFIDGDTTHFHVPESVMKNGVLKARYLAVNTPESTGAIEEYGKKASEFTKEKLSSAAAILVESETSEWDPDSTGDRYLVWVWYKPDAASPYRNLNIELLQNGLSIANSSASNQYGETCMKAINQAKEQKLNIHSGLKDPDFYYGDAIELTLKELRTNMQSYVGKKVAFNGVVSTNSGAQGIYVEDFDAETDMYYGIYIYYGHGLNGGGLDVLKVGNLVRIVGRVQYYEAGGTYQVADLNYQLMKPNDPDNIQKIEAGHAAAYRLTEPGVYANGTVTVQLEEGTLTAPYAELALATSMEIQGLKVVDAYTTTAEDSSSKGAMTLVCESPEGIGITVRTAVLLDAENKVITQDAYLGKTINVKGIADVFDGQYQIKVFLTKNITIIEQ